MNRAVALVARAVGRVRDDVGLPVADELTLETELSGAIGRGRIGVEHGDERPGIGHGVRASDGRQRRCAARRNPRGDTLAARCKVRTKFGRSRKPTSSAMPEIRRVSWACFLASVVPPALGAAWFVVTSRAQ